MRGKIVRARVTPSSVRRAARYMRWLCRDALTLVELMCRDDVQGDMHALYVCRLRQLLEERAPLWMHLEIKCDGCACRLAQVPRGRCARLGRDAAIDSAAPGLESRGCWVSGSGRVARHYCPDCAAPARAAAAQRWLEAGGYWPPKN